MKYFKFLFSPIFMGALLIVFVIAMAFATFIENDYGSGASYSMVYNTRWFEAILLLLAVNLVGQLIIFKMFRRSRLPVAFFHLAFLMMIAGAAITRYTGWEGTIHIREGATSDQCYSADKYISYSVKDESGKVISHESRKYSMTTASADNFRRQIKTGDRNYQLVLARIIPNAAESISDDPSGSPVISLLVINNTGIRETLVIKKGETKRTGEISMGFGSGENEQIRFELDSGNFYMKSDFPVSRMSMMTQESDTIHPGSRLAVKPMQLLGVRDIRIIPQKMSVAGSVKAVAVDPSEQETGQDAFIFHVFGGSKSASFYLWSRESEPVSSGSCEEDGYIFEVKYRSEIRKLPFELKLNDFVLERYPGSSSPSGYKSEILLTDRTAGIEKPFSIYMNNILKYKGYRIYQSSFDRDEKGTVLSVNHDMAGMLVSYAGYALLFLFIILSLLSKNSQFRNIRAGAWLSPLRKTAASIILLLIISGLGKADAQKFVAGKESADEMGKVLVQDQKGRTRPLYTITNDILRKVSRENSLEGLSPMQVFFGFYTDFNNWKDVPVIRISNRDLQKQIGITGKYAAFSDLVDLGNNGSYKLSAEVNKAYAKSPSQRNKYDKEVMKVDERVNIVYMIYKGDFMKLFPLKDGSHNWGIPEEALRSAAGREDSAYLKSVMPLLTDALETNNTLNTRKIAESISAYQDRFAGYELPSERKINAEILYYRLGIFEKLFPFYATLGLIMVISLIVMVIKGIKEKSKFVKALGWILFAGFIFHTAGLALRWYVAGHSPMSNGYESLIFISWVTILAGFIFSRKSSFALSATAVLGGMTLMVAHLSFMDPEITNLVPVLKSYWLTLHVSVITGSYGFLGLGAILGIITMILLALANDKNIERISDTIDELVVINFRTLTLGLYFLTIGTFLGAIWANESWGRYWGWDPKETWSLITIMVYAFVTHSRMIPGLKSIFTYNILSLFGFSSVLMTYFGVNFYLSGLHSYASGEPVPVPAFVYIGVILITALCIAAFMKYRRFEPKNGN